MRIQAMIDTQNPASQPTDYPQIPVTNPVTGEVIGTIPALDRDAVAEAVARARAAQPAWEALSPRERARIVRGWNDDLWARRDEIIPILRRETGKTAGDAFLEIAAQDNLNLYYIKAAPRLLRPQKRPTLFPIIHSAVVMYRARGVCGFITPWNYPVFLAWIDLVPALLAGNAVVLKPSEITPYSSLWLADRLREHLSRAGQSPDLIQVVTGDGRTGAALVDQVDYIAFTGSTATGRKVGVRAAERLIPFSLELGGNDPCIVLDDANLDMAAAGVLVGALENTGQACVSTERVYVLESVYDRFVDKVQHYIRQIRMAVDDPDAQVGSMINEREVQRVEAQVADAVARGARVLCGGRRRPDLGPLFYEPTVLVDVDHAMAVMRDETFGPLIPIMKVRDEDEAVRLANDSSFGLSAVIFSDNLARARRLAARITSGDVTINKAHLNFYTPSVPMGGEKDSGLGRRNGPEGLMRFVRPHSIVVQRPWHWLIRPYLAHHDPLTVTMYKLWRHVRRRIPWLA
ncbi:MAG: succinic semialdehyde dehydrogenase [Candidatus Flexifilum sp.]|jgi:aldehyde dehydrogenase (NAD+)/succinate-semialdehyde dehydrogenase/glutarate-semialdehyde dehydrogenase